MVMALTMSNTVHQIQKLILNSYERREDTIIRQDLIKIGNCTQIFLSNSTSTLNLAQSNSCTDSRATNIVYRLYPLQ